MDHPKLLGNHRELLADLYAELDERVTVVRAEAFGFRQFVPHDVTRQVGIERLAMAALLARMRRDGPIRDFVGEAYHAR
ncbi:hypothetical protein WK66_17405 [Burkholderia ubonensis]|nr:hypothetical protein WK66_17405 [Burkholderia ubonensis]